MNAYEFSLDSGLANAFVAKLEQELWTAGYEKMLEYSNPGGPDIMQFQQRRHEGEHDRRSVTIELVEEGETSERVRVTSEDADCRPLMRKAALACVSEMGAVLFARLAGLPTDRMQARIEAALAPLVAECQQ